MKSHTQKPTRAYQLEGCTKPVLRGYLWEVKWNWEKWRKTFNLYAIHFYYAWIFMINSNSCSWADFTEKNRSICSYHTFKD